MTSKFWMGVLFGIATFAGLLLTTTVMFAVVKLGVFKRRSPIYLISTANMLCDCIQLVLAITYLVPSIICDSWLFEGERHNKFSQFLGAVFLFCWYYGSVAQILMAVNRVCVICVHTSRFFSYRNVLIIVIILFPIAIIVAWISQYVSPCCKFSFDHKYLSYSYTVKDDVPNYSNMYIDLPLNSSSSAICAACYFYIILYVWKMSHLFKVDAAENGKRIKEYRYALQFCAISVFYLCGWVTFRIFPVLIGARGVEYFIVISACVTLNSSANAIVYISSNLEPFINVYQSVHLPEFGAKLRVEGSLAWPNKNKPTCFKSLFQETSSMFMVQRMLFTSKVSTLVYAISSRTDRRRHKINSVSPLQKW